MHIDTIQRRLHFLHQAEKLKSTIRSAHTSTGRPESTAEHSWRLCLLAMAFEDELVGLDMLKVLKIAVVHDLAEAIYGDIPAVVKDKCPDKEEQERDALRVLTDGLDEPLKKSILSLWEDYETGSSPEALAVKALDKLETILQHNQGLNPPDFDYAFNLSYGQEHMKAAPLFERIRAILDRETSGKLGAGDAGS